MITTLPMTSLDDWIASRLHVPAGQLTREIIADRPPSTGAKQRIEVCAEQ